MISFIYALGWFGVFLFPFLESIGVPIPTAFAFIAAIALIEAEGTTAMTPYFVIAVLVIGQMGGSLIGYALGLKGLGWAERKLAGSAKFRKTYATMERFYARWGIPTVIIARLCGYLRPWTSLASGIMKMRFLPFASATLVGSILWSLMTLWLIHSGYKPTNAEESGVWLCSLF